MKKRNKIFTIVGFVLALIYSINFFLVYSAIGPNILGIGYEREVENNTIDKNIITNTKQKFDNVTEIKNQQQQPTTTPPPTTSPTITRPEDDIQNLLDKYEEERAQRAEDAWKAGQERIERMESLNE